MKSGVKLRGHLRMVVEILDLIAKDPAQHRRELSRDREFVRMALSAENGVAEAIAMVARHSELWAQASEPISFFKGSNAEYVFALVADGLKGLRTHHGQIRDGRLLPELTPEQILLLERLENGSAVPRRSRASSHRRRLASPPAVEPAGRSSRMSGRPVPGGRPLSHRPRHPKLH